MKREKIFKICSNTGCHLKTLPGIYELIDGKVGVNNIRDVEIEDLLGREPVELNIEEIAGYLKDKTVLVTGGGGSIGSELCRQIARFSPKSFLFLIYMKTMPMTFKWNFKENIQILIKR